MFFKLSGMERDPNPAHARRSIIFLTLVVMMIFASSIGLSYDNLHEEYRRAARNPYSTIYYMVTGETFALMADCPASEWQGQKAPPGHKAPMSYVEFGASDRAAAERFVKERYDGCRYYMLDSPISLRR